MKVNKAFSVKTADGAVKVPAGTHKVTLTLTAQKASMSSDSFKFSLPVPKSLFKYGIVSYPSFVKLKASEIGQNFDLDLSQSRQTLSSHEELTTVSCQLNSSVQECHNVRQSNGTYEEECETVTTGSAPARVRYDDVLTTRVAEFVQGGSRLAQFVSQKRGDESTILEQGSCSR